MPCYHPLKGWRSRRVNASGKRSIVFQRSEGFSDLAVEIPCGQCIGCRLERSRQWAIRCVHEASLYEDNCFVTLTYDDEHLPESRSLVLRDFQLFMKRLRMLVGMGFDSGIRFFHCGEYGEKFERPHYHACIFNWDFPDKVHYKTRGGFKYYNSGMLDACWSDSAGRPIGFAVIGDVTFESAAYVARYVTKKVTGENAAEFYEGRKPEYVTMSRARGIGSGWMDKFQGDVFPSDEVVLRGRRLRPPKFYDKVLEMKSPADYQRMKALRKRKAFLFSDDNTPERLAVRESITKQKMTLLKRGFESA